MLIAAAYGLTSGEVYLLRKYSGSYLVSHEFNAVLYWFVEGFYCLGGLVTIAFTLSLYRAERHSI